MIRLYNTFATAANEVLSLKTIFFSGGEPHCEVKPEEITDQCIWIDARLGTPQDFLMLLCVYNTVKALRPRSIGLFVPYIPGGRQDRQFPGGPCTIKIYTQIINSLEVDTVLTLDPHSDVTTALLNNATVIPVGLLLNGRFSNFDAYISPDAGATKRVSNLAEDCGIENVLQGFKKRDPKTGKLAGFSLEPLPDIGDYMIVDDLCDGGGTFLGLAECFKKDPKAEGSTLSLYVSHGIFSNGIDKLSRVFEKIFTTDSFPGTERFKTEIESGKLTVIDLWPAAASWMKKNITR